jgi:nucleoside-diphosphate-sugar epimerase
MNEWLLEDLINQSDIVYHLAAAVGVKLIIHKPIETIETNILGTENVLKFTNKVARPQRTVGAMPPQKRSTNFSPLPIIRNTIYL